MLSEGKSSVESDTKVDWERMVFQLIVIPPYSKLSTSLVVVYLERSRVCIEVPFLYIWKG